MKICTKCKIEKEFSEFSKGKNGKNGLVSWCKSCYKQYNFDNKEKQYLKNKQYNINNKEFLKQQKKLYELNNSEEIKRKRKLYYSKNKERIIKKRKQYYLDNKDSINECKNKYSKNRKSIDPLYKLIINVRCLIRNSINENGYTKKSKTYEILGCSFEDFKIHLEQQFTEGMTWENRTLWHLDHIYPVSRAIDEEHLIRLNHYTNFQPLWAIDNIKKGNKIINNQINKS
jgi:hypothetical protein